MPGHNSGGSPTRKGRDAAPRAWTHKYADENRFELTGDAEGGSLDHGLTTNQFSVVGNRKRPPHQITLHLIASFLTKEGTLKFGFNTFREDRNLKAVTKPNDRPHNRHGITIMAQIADKGAIDLDPIERE